MADVLDAELERAFPRATPPRVLKDGSPRRTPSLRQASADPLEAALDQAFAPGGGAPGAEIGVAPAEGRADPGFLAGLAKAPEAMVRLLIGGASPQGFAEEMADFTTDVGRAGGGDDEAAARLRGRGIAMSLASSVVPGGPAIRGGMAATALFRALGARSALGALGGAAGGALEAAGEARDPVPDVLAGAAVGSVFNPVLGVLGAGVQALIRQRLAKRLAEMELERAGRPATLTGIRQVAGLVRASQEIPPGITNVGPELGALELPGGPRFAPRQTIGPTPEPGVRGLPPEVPGIIVPETPEPGLLDLPIGRPGAIEPRSVRGTRQVPPGPAGGLPPPAPARAFAPPDHVTALDQVERFVRVGRPVPGEVADRAAREVAAAVGGAPETAVDRVLDALRRAPRVIKRQAELFKLERGKRIAAARGVRPLGTGGREAFNRQLARMSGEMRKIDFESLAPLVSSDDMDTLFNMADAHPALDDFDKIIAQRGLRKLFGEEGGAVPTRDELIKLQTVFGKAFIGEVLAKRPTIDKILDSGLQILGGWRSFITGYDFSAPLFQGLYIGAGNPKEFGRAFVSMFKYAGSKRAFDALQANIQRRPTYLLMKRAGLALTDLGHILSEREEAFMSTWAEKIPGIGASNRAYVGFLNRIRADVFDKLVREGRQTGIDPGADLVFTRQIADFVNDASGRGKLGKIGSFDLARHADLLNAGFFSPRLMASRVRLLNPLLYVHANPVVRKQALRSLFGMTAAGAAVMGLAQAGGAEVENNPKSVDFGKIKLGDTRYDIFGGFTQYARLAANLLPFAGGPEQGTRLDYLGRFAQSKASPAAGFALDLLRGTDFKGDELATPEAIKDRFVPLVIQDLWDASREWGGLGLLMAAPALFGVRIQTYD